MRLALTGARLPTGQSIPIWISALQMAEAWGIPPWEIMERSGSLRWMARWKFYREQVARVEKDALDTK